jgi:hypothetical protein
LSFEKLGGVSMKDKLSLLGIVLLALVAMLGPSALLRGTLNADPHASVLSESSQAIERANSEFKAALTAVKEAEAAGADSSKIAVLVERLNMVLGRIDEAESLLIKENVTEANGIAEGTIDVSKRIALEAIELRNEASLKTYYDKIFTLSMAPVASLLVTFGAHYGWKFWRRREIDRMMRMEIKKVKEPEEEK